MTTSNYSGTVDVPPEMAEILAEIEDRVKSFFGRTVVYPKQGRIEIDRIRYMWASAESLGMSFRKILEDQFGSRGTETILYSFGKSMGKTEARRFHDKFRMQDPIKKLFAGPVYFSYSGWAFVEPLPLRSLEFNDNYITTYRHPNSFEAEIILKEKKKTDRPVCYINAGYSAGWCSESSGIPLEARELTCVARGDEHCVFMMTHKDKLDYRVAIYQELSSQGKEVTLEDLLSV